MSVDADAFREAMALWATGVTIVASRQPAGVVATTVSAFTSLSLEPPLVLVALGANATVRPFLAPGQRFGISILADTQRRLGSIFADPYPVGPDPFPPDGDAILDTALVGLACTVTEARAGGDHLLVIATVADVRISAADHGPLIRYARRYHGLDG